MIKIRLIFGLADFFGGEYIYGGYGEFLAAWGLLVALTHLFFKMATVTTVEENDVVANTFA